MEGRKTQWFAGRMRKILREGPEGEEGLQGLLADVTPPEAHWRPVSEQPSIADLVAHLTYRYAWTAHELRPRHPHPGPDPWQRPAPAPGSWEELRKRLVHAVEACAETVQEADEALLEWAVPGREGPWRDVLTDLLLEAMYTAGQIAVLRRWYATQEIAV
ncbi:MAG: DinB family protein [Armatimonadota bacterium]|nr:DinB family protein [Armatimonadota bacterium]MDR7563786.1 DinB family protein [Armatimonadota bacterium]MDR7602109.1 DinB family protein [Armatimonadota bacterium]